MKKITLALMAFIMLTNCGYKKVYSNKNFNFSITKIEKLKEDKLNLIIEKRLNNFSNKKALNQISLETNAGKQIIIVSRDTRGDPSRYQMIVKLSVTVTDNQNKKKNKDIIQVFSYNTTANRFSLNQYEKEIEEILINKIIDETIKHISQF